MKVIAPADYSFVTALERPVAAGEEVDVDDELGAALIDQGWRTATARKRGAAKAGTEGETDAPDTAPSDEER